MQVNLDMKKYNQILRGCTVDAVAVVIEIVVVTIVAVDVALGVV